MSDGPVVLLKLGCTLAETVRRVGDYEAWFQRALPEEVLGLVDAEDPDAALPDDISALIIMGSIHSVYEGTDWIKRGMDLARQALDADVPTLGVCFGHQLLTEVLGGKVERHEGGFEGGTVSVDLTDAGREDPLFDGLVGPVVVNESHGDTVTRAPEGAKVLAYNDHDGHQAMRLGEKVWSVQFHPEMSRPEVVLALKGHREKMIARGLDPEAAIRAARVTPHGPRLLRNFLRLARAGSDE